MAHAGENTGRNSADRLHNITSNQLLAETQ